MNIYAKKEQRLLDAMRNDGFSLFDGNEKEAYETLEMAFASFSEYVDIVTKMETLIPIWRERCERADYLFKVESIDQRRRNAHNHTISCLKMLNKISESCGLGPFAEVDTNNRWDVADFAGEFVSNFYDSGIHRDPMSRTSW